MVAAPTADQGIVLTYSPGPGGPLVPHPSSASPSGGADDVSALARGQVSLTDLAVDPQAPGADFGLAARLAPVLRP